MANIHIKELFGSDNITDLTEKVNFNFDQLILAGGGPEGPIGPTGNNGVSGPEGVRGSQWVAGSGATTINLPTDGVYRKNDFLLNDGGSFVGGATGQVWYYGATQWFDTGINLIGPQGPQGDVGDGSINILGGYLQQVTNIDSPFNAFVPNFGSTNPTPTGDTYTLGTYLSQTFSKDKDDYSTNGNFINAGLDFIGIGRGNNSLVLGRYATLFQSGSAGATYSPPGSNKVMKNFPQLEADVPMLLISQNDYKNPSTGSPTYSNGISIGLTKTHPDASYGSGDPYSGQEMDYFKNANISIENKYHDLKISSSNLLSLQSVSGAGGFFRLGSSTVRTGYNSVDFRSTKLQTVAYTNFKISDSFFIDLSDSTGSVSTNELIHNAQSTFFQNSKFYVSDASTTDNDTRQETAKTFIGTRNDTSGKIGANELVFFNGDSLTTDADDKTISKTLDPTTSGSTPSDFNTRSIFDSDNKNFVFRIGQTTVQPGYMEGGTTGEPILKSGYSNKINITYQGQGYDTPFIQYSGIDIFNTYNNSINSGTYDHYSPYATIPNNSTLSQALGYDIREPLQWNNTNNKEGSISMTRMGIYPGFFRKDKSSNTYIGDSNARQKKFFDVAHRMMPTGSLDVFGTVRIREQETTDNGAKDGWIAVNKKDGIIGFQEPSQASSTPTFSIIMFPEMASNKFSFYIESSKQFGASSAQVGDGKAYNYVPPIGGTSRPPFAAFPGKGSDELKDYYICNGAVLADSRDCIATGPFSKMKGMNVSADNGNSKVQNGTLVSSGTPSDYDYEPNPDFIGINGATHGSSPQIPASAGNWTDYVCDFFNGMGSMSNSLGSWGCSVLAGELADSKFRIILPNYFGRVAKMQFPDSDLMVRAISGHKLDKNQHLQGAYTASGYPNGEERDSGYIYHKANGKYNASWMMKGMFDSAGFPYLSGSQTPKMAMPKHRHKSGALITDSHVQGDHNHSVSIDTNDDSNGGSNTSEGATTSQGSFNSGQAGGFTHSHVVTGTTDYTGDFAISSNPNPDNDYDIEHYYVTGTGFSNNQFLVVGHFGYDIFGNDGFNVSPSIQYSNFSNWLNYKKSVVVDSDEQAKADSSGQKFITAPFKGTIMAINLKGVRNPNRNNTVIKDLHYIAGVPVCGVNYHHSAGSPPEADMSWYSNAYSQGVNGPNLFATAKIYVDGRFGPTTGAKSNEWWVDNFYEYGYKDMSRNDDTMHPYTFVNSSRTENTSQLDYNTYSPTFAQKYTYDLYKTNITREDDFDL
tara:strand:+ start:1859 stop:5632 length:3774 start_codon:yes stop_codon:yes gene_type:complete